MVLESSVEKRMQPLYKKTWKSIVKSNENIQDLKLNHKQLEDVMKQLLKLDTINEENKSLVFKLIDKIIIDDNKITIKYKFNNIEL